MEKVNTRQLSGELPNSGAAMLRPYRRWQVCVFQQIRNMFGRLRGIVEKEAV